MIVLTVAKLGDITSLSFVDATRLVVWAEKVVPRKAARTFWDVTTGSRSDEKELDDILKGIRRQKLRSGDWEFSGSNGLQRRLEACNHTTGRTVSDEVEIPFRNLALTPDGRALVFYYGRSFRNEPKGYGGRTWSDGAFGPGFSVTAYTDGDPHQHSFGGLAPLADSTRFVTIDYRTFDLHPRLAARSVATGEVLTSTPIEVRETPTLVAAPGREQLVAVSGASLFVFDAADLTARRRVRKDGRKHFTEVAYHPSGRFLAATTNDETVMLYDTTNWEVVRTFTWEIGRMRSIAFSPDGTLAAAGGDKGKVVVWDVDV